MRIARGDRKLGGESKYKYCKLCGKECHGSDREEHVKLQHRAEMDTKVPSEYFSVINVTKLLKLLGAE